MPKCLSNLFTYKIWYKNLTITVFKYFPNLIGIIRVWLVRANISGINMAQSYPLKKLILKKLYTICEQNTLSHTMKNSSF